jgi:hypothetical protein
MFTTKEMSSMKTRKPINGRILILSSLSRMNWRVWLPSRGNIVFTLVVAFSLFWAQSANALPWARPAVVAASTGIWPYQGRLANSAGAPVTATVPMTFKLYNVSSAGTALWQEQWASMQVTGGLFNVMLGSLTAIPQGIVSGNNSLWLGITVGTDSEMTPRVQLGSTPFAWTVPDGSITTTKLADANVTTAKITDANITTAKIANGAVTKAKLGADVSFIPPDGSVTTAKLADANITTAKIANGAITQAKLDANVSLIPPDGSITTAKLLDNAVTRSKIGPSVALQLVQTGEFTTYALQGTGDRTIRTHITFGTSYSTPPVITVGVHALDADANFNIRFDSYPENITGSGFDLVMLTWSDSNIFILGIYWIAIGSQ